MLAAVTAQAISAGPNLQTADKSLTRISEPSATFATCFHSSVAKAWCLVPMCGSTKIQMAATRAAILPTVSEPTGAFLHQHRLT
jgi:hypothetical protein